MKNRFLIILLILSGSGVSAQQTNFNQLQFGLSYGIPYDSDTRKLNGNLLKLSLQQDFRLGNLISLSVLGDYNHSKGKSLFRDINNVGLGGGIKIQMIPIFQFINTKILKTDSIHVKYNVFIQSNATVNIHNTKYFDAGTLYDNTFQIGVELFDKKKYVYKIFYAFSMIEDNTKYDYLAIPNQPKNITSRTFGELGIAIGIKNLSKRNNKVE
jgi:hypothetical protein